VTRRIPPEVMDPTTGLPWDPDAEAREERSWRTWRSLRSRLHALGAATDCGRRVRCPTMDQQEGAADWWGNG
jgi:hypothetical protein